MQQPRPPSAGVVLPPPSFASCAADTASLPVGAASPSSSLLPLTSLSQTAVSPYTSAAACAPRRGHTAAAVAGTSRTASAAAAPRSCAAAGLPVSYNFNRTSSGTAAAGARAGRSAAASGQAAATPCPSITVAASRTLRNFLPTQAIEAFLSSSAKPQLQKKQSVPPSTIEQELQQHQKHKQQQQQRVYVQQQQQQQQQGQTGCTKDRLVLPSFTEQQKLSLQATSSLLHPGGWAAAAAAPAPCALASPDFSFWPAASAWRSCVAASAAPPSCAPAPPAVASAAAAAARSFSSTTGGARHAAIAAASPAAGPLFPTAGGGAFCTAAAVASASETADAAAAPPCPSTTAAAPAAASAPASLARADRRSVCYDSMALEASETVSSVAADAATAAGGKKEAPAASRETKTFAAGESAAFIGELGGSAVRGQEEGRSGGVAALDSRGDSEDAVNSLASTGFLTSPASSVPVSDSESPRSGISVRAPAAAAGYKAAAAGAEEEGGASAAAGATTTAVAAAFASAAAAPDSATEKRSDASPEKNKVGLHSFFGSPRAAAAAADTSKRGSLLLISSSAAAAATALEAATFRLTEAVAPSRLREAVTAAGTRRRGTATAVARAKSCSRTSAPTAAVRSSSAAGAAAAGAPPLGRGRRLYSVINTRFQRTTAAATGKSNAAAKAEQASTEAAAESAFYHTSGERVVMRRDMPVLPPQPPAAAAAHPSGIRRRAAAAAGRRGEGLRRRSEEAEAACAARAAEAIAAAAAVPQAAPAAALRVATADCMQFQQVPSLSTAARHSVSSSSSIRLTPGKDGAACDVNTPANAESPFAAAAAAGFWGDASSCCMQGGQESAGIRDATAVPSQDMSCVQQLLQPMKMQQQTQVQHPAQRVLQQQHQQHPVQQGQTYTLQQHQQLMQQEQRQAQTLQQQQQILLLQQGPAQRGQQQQLPQMEQETQQQRAQIPQQQQEVLQGQKLEMPQGTGFFEGRASQGGLTETATALRSSSSYSSMGSCSTSTSCSKSGNGEGGRKQKARTMRACPKSLSTKEILSKPPRGRATTVSRGKYRCAAGQGIQVPSVRMETTPLKLNNWSVSWQEVLCYNPRPYDITQEFKENYIAMRSEMEEAITNIVDIVFVDRNFSHLATPYVYHAYLIPPVRPHSPLTAASIQCHTSDDWWLQKGGWRRVRRSDTGGRVVEVLQPTNPQLIPFSPGITVEQQRQQRLQHASQSGHPLYSQQRPSHLQLRRGKSKLPLHLWVFLGGKDMQALDGLVLAWKFLRFASEIPPSEFVEANESTAGPRCGTKVKKDYRGETHGTLDWRGRLSGAELYKHYHQLGRSPAYDQLVGKNVGSSTGFSPFGPFLYDMKGVTEAMQYRIAFLMVDIPGYGNSSGHPSPDTIRSCVLQSLKHALLELVEHHDEEEIVINVLGYSLGCAVAVALCADLAESICNDLAAGLEVGSPDAAAACCSCCSNGFFSPSPVPPRWSETNCNNLFHCHSCLSKIETASQALEEQLKGVRLEQQGGGGKTTLHAGVTFDAAANLTFKDTCNITMHKDAEGTPYVSRLKEEHIRQPAAFHKLRGLTIAVNRLVLVAPFTSVQAMASRVAAATVGGGGLISRAAGALVSRQINWDNEASLRRLFSCIHDIEEQSRTDIFQNFRLHIHHGECDTVIPWTMGYEVYRTAESLKASFNLHRIPIQFVKMAEETHSSILCGIGELTLLESCFCPYRLHPAAPLAVLKFYSRQCLLRRPPGTFTVGPPIVLGQASTGRTRTRVTNEKSSNTTSVKLNTPIGLSRTRFTRKSHSSVRVTGDPPHGKTSCSTTDGTAPSPSVEMLLCGESRSSLGNSTSQKVGVCESAGVYGTRVPHGKMPTENVGRRSHSALSPRRNRSYVTAATAQSDLARFLASALAQKSRVAGKPFSSATYSTMLPLATGVPVKR